MEKHYYLHAWGVTGYDDDTRIKNPNATPIVLENIGLRIDYWPPDDLFSISPLFFVTERLKSILVYKNFSGLSFEKIEKISKGANFLENYPDAQLPPFYWKLEINDNIENADFALWHGTYLIISGRVLDCLRDNHVTHAEADLIPGSFDEYFNSADKYFWMTDNAKAYFIESEKKKNPRFK